MRTEYEENQTWTRLLALSTTLGNFLNFLEPQIPQILNRHKDKVNVSCKKEAEESMQKAWQRAYYGVKGQCQFLPFPLPTDVCLQPELPTDPEETRNGKEEQV